MSLVLKGVSHRFGDVLAVHHATLEAAAGEIVCLFGPSGCGKTTLLRIAAGLETLQEGAVELGGETLASPGRMTPPEKRPLGLVFQDFVLFPHMTVEKNIAFGVAGVRKAKALVTEQLEAMRITALAERYPHELSGGQQQRVALARALIRKPKALLLDEPFASIDATLRRRLRDEMRRVLKDQNVAVILVTHDPEEALALGDRIALMRQGRVIETASPEALFHTPQTPDGARLFPGSQTLNGVIRNGRFMTAIGEFDARGKEDGEGVVVLRAGALSAAEDVAGGYSVIDCRFTGPAWTAYLEMPEGEDPLRVSMDAPPQLGSRVAVSVDPAQSFIFDKQ